MKLATFKEEQKLWNQGYRLVAGIDEVGRGPLAGPVVACAVVCLPKSDLGAPKSDLGNMRDSKQLSPKQREEFYEILVNHPAIAWGAGKTFPSVIDRINIYHATQLAMVRAVTHLHRKLNNLDNIQNTTHASHTSKFGSSNRLRYIDFLILDGNMRLDVNIPQLSFPKADENVFSCAAASIIAKVRRDRLMLRYHKQYAQYGFDTHKGYGTKKHRHAIAQYGPSPLHRRSFALQ